MKGLSFPLKASRWAVGLSLILTVCLEPVRSVHADPAILYVAPALQGSGDCSSWANACLLQSALDGASVGDEIWVKMGVYKPTSNPDARAAKFNIVDGLAVYGGFSGAETTRDERDWHAYPTILSGDIDGDDLNTDGNFIAESTADLQGANSYNVVTLSNAGSGTVFDGFIVTAGNADTGAAGVLNYYGSPTLSNLLIVGNAAEYAAGMQNNRSSPTLTNVVFLNNAATSDVGGLHNYYDCNVMMTNVAFIGNSAGGGGGAMSSYICTVTVNNAVFIGNHAAGGGAISSNQSTNNLKNTTFFGNTATNSGGGISVYFSGLNLRNVIMWGDQAASLNEIQNVRDKYGDYSSGIHVAYSDIQGCGGSTAWAGGDCGTNGGGNIDLDPLFVDSANGNLRLQLTSPVVDAGRNSDVQAGLTTDLDGLARFVDIDTVTDTGDGTPPIVDMGAYEAHLDSDAPVVESITRLDPNPTSASSVRFLVTFSEPAARVDVSDFSLAASGITGAQITGVSGGPGSYQIYVSTGTGAGSLRLDVPDTAAVSDLAGNPLSGLPFTSGEAYTIDLTSPTVISITRTSPSRTNASSLNFNLTFSEAVKDVDTSDFSLTTSGGLAGCSVTGMVDTGDQTSWMVSVDTGTGDGTLRLDLPGTAEITDLAGNPLAGLPYTSGQQYTVDKTAPSVVSITRLDPSPTFASSVDFLVTFSEAVEGLDGTDFFLTLTGTLFPQPIWSIVDSGDHLSYTVTVGTGTGSGTMGLNVHQSSDVADLAGNPLAGLPYTFGEIYEIRISYIYLPVIRR